MNDANNKAQKPRELLVSFGNNIEACEKWREQIPPYLKGRLHYGQTPEDEIHVSADVGAISAFERDYLVSLVDLSAPTQVKPDSEEVITTFAGSAPRAHALGAQETAAAEARDPGPLPDEVLSVPGFINDYMAYQMATVAYPNRPLIFAGALTMLAHLSGRHHCSTEDLRTNIYVIALAESGAGKDQPRKVNQRLAKELHLVPTMADRFASAEGLEDALLQYPASFFQVDEVDTLFTCMREKDAAMERIYGAVLQFFTTANGVYVPRKKALLSTSTKRNAFDAVRANGIEAPHLVLLGTAVPEYFYRGLDERAIASGLLSRCLVIEAHPRGDKGTPHKAPFPTHLLEDAAYLAEHACFKGVDLDCPETALMPPRIDEVEMPTAATDLFNRIANAADARYKASADNASKTLWTRAAEKAMKLAMLYAISENVRHPVISTKGLLWAWHVVEHTTRRTLFQAAQYLTENAFHELRQKAIRYLRDLGGKARHGTLLKRLHVDSENFRRLIETMEESGIITKENGGYNSVFYTLVT